MNAIIRAHHLGLTYHPETARQFSIKIIISLMVVSLGIASLILEETRPDLYRGQRTLHAAKIKAQRASRKIKSLFS